MDAGLDHTTLLDAIARLDSATVDSMLSRTPALAALPVTSEGGRTQTLLHRATPGDGDPLHDAHLLIVQRILGAGAEVDRPGWGANNGFCTPLTMAAWGGHASIIRLLLNHGANPNGCAEQIACGNRPVDTAARHGHGAAVEELILAGADHGFDHLLMSGLRDRVESALRVDPGMATVPVRDGLPPLHSALITRAGSALVPLLLDHGANVNQADPRGRTSLHAAIELVDPLLIELLLAHGAEVDSFAAAGLGQVDRLSMLLEADDSLAVTAQTDGTTALHYAAWSGSENCARLLLGAGTDVSPRSERFWACLTPIHIALQRRQAEVVSLLVERGADLETAASVPFHYWPTPLHVAARWGTREQILDLLDHGADPNGGGPVEGSLDTGIVGWLAQTGDVDLGRLLLERGLDVYSERLRETLLTAAENGHVDLLRLVGQGDCC